MQGLKPHVSTYWQTYLTTLLLLSISIMLTILITNKIIKNIINIYKGCVNCPQILSQVTSRKITHICCVFYVNQIIIL